MTSTDLLWWAALVVQLLAIPGTLLPVLPGLVLLPLGALLWCWAVGFGVAWPVLLLALLSGMLVSRLAQMLLAVLGVVGFLLLSLWGPAAG